MEARLYRGIGLATRLGVMVPLGLCRLGCRTEFLLKTPPDPAV